MEFYKLISSGIFILALSGCSDSDVNSIKNGVMKTYSENLTVGQALESWSKIQKCDTTTWESFKSERGEKIVSFRCSIEKEASFSSIGLNTKTILESIGIYDINAIYSKLENEINGFENQKKQLMDKIQQEEQILSDLNSKFSERKEEKKLLELELKKIYIEEEETRKNFEVIWNKYNDSALLPKDPVEKKKAIETLKNAYQKRDEIQKRLSIKKDEIQTEMSKIRADRFEEQELQGKEHSLQYMKKNAQEKIASMNSSIEKGKKDVQNIEMTSDALEQLKKVNLIIQFTLTADGKSFAPSYEGVEYTYKDSKTYEKHIATNTRDILMITEARKRFGLGNGLLISTYLNKIFEVGYTPELYEQRK